MTHTPLQGPQFQGPETEGPFTVVTESAEHDDYDLVGARWRRQEREYATEREAVGAWEAARLYVNLRPVSITPEPNWSRYSYDGHTPLAKW